MFQKVGKGSVICGWVRTRSVANQSKLVSRFVEFPDLGELPSCSAGRVPPISSSRAISPAVISIPLIRLLFLRPVALLLHSFSQPFALGNKLW